MCSLKLRRELATSGNNPPDTHFHISDVELEDYRSSHSPKPRSPFARSPWKIIRKNIRINFVSERSAIRPEEGETR